MKLLLLLYRRSYMGVCRNQSSTGGRNTPVCIRSYRKSNTTYSSSAASPLPLPKLSTRNKRKIGTERRAYGSTAVVPHSAAVPRMSTKQITTAWPIAADCARMIATASYYLVMVDGMMCGWHCLLCVCWLLCQRCV